MALSDFKLLAAFIQVNTRKGYRYLDEAGKIMNYYDERFPQKTVSLQGLFLANPDARLRQIQVSTERVWLYIDEPDTLRYVTDHARLEVENICMLMGVESFKRVGLRLQYLHALRQPEKYMAAAQPRIFSDSLNRALASAGAPSLDTFEMKLTIKQGELNVAVTVSPVKKAPGAAEAAGLPENAVIFDPDIYSEGEITLPEFRRFLRSAEAWIEDSAPHLVTAFLPEV
ncbi:MAG: hypothetical protein ACYDCQ_13550 [Dehalococcoidia bacterium]